jgi:hypothetical protein
MVGAFAFFVSDEQKVFPLQKSFAAFPEAF